MTRSGPTSKQRLLVLTLRGATAALAAAMAAIHLDLYAGYGYSHIPTIGALFIFNGVLGALLALALVASPRVLLAPVAAVTAVFLAATIGGLVLAVNGGVFGFTESTSAPLFDQAIAVEAAGAAAGLWLAGLTWPLTRARFRAS